MENYESLGTIGEGTYGVVVKCRHKITGQIVAIKKFKESDDDEQVKKTALREIHILKQLKHENIVSLLEVFRLNGKLYLVFEFVEKTILEEIERHPEGLDRLTLKKLMWQLVRAIKFCHQHNIIHRDIKPENLLVSRNGVLKLCDFGFARSLASAGAKYTEYVSTRWYRAPELLVGDVSYGKAVDVWSIGCMFAEIATGLPLFPGDSDIDQLYHIIRCLGHITSRQQELFRKNALYVGVKLPQSSDLESLEARFPTMDKTSLDFIRQTIVDEPLDRWTCAELFKHPFFDNSHEAFEAELQEAITRDLNDTIAVRKKRSRKSCRGSTSTGITHAISAPLPVPNPSTESMASLVSTAGDTSKSLVKPLFVPMATIHSKKEKESVATSDNSSTKVQVVLRKTPGVGIPLGAYHLPTLSSTTSSTSTMYSVSTGNGGDGGDTNLLFSQTTKLRAVPLLSEHHGGTRTTYGQPTTSDPMTYVSLHDNVRVSMTSHGSCVEKGGKSAGGIAVRPYQIPSSKPPSSFCMKTSYGVQQSSSKHESRKSDTFYTSKKSSVAGKNTRYVYNTGGCNSLKKGSSTSVVASGNMTLRRTPQSKLYDTS